MSESSPNRRDKLRVNFSPAKLRGVEIAASEHRVVGRGEGTVRHLSPHEASPLTERVFGGNRPPSSAERLDYVVASHVVQQVPDLIGWLLEIHALLKPTGELRLAIPDARFTADRLRGESRLTDVLAAHARGDRRPDLHARLDASLYAVPIDAAAAWHEQIDDDALRQSRLRHITRCLALAREPRPAGQPMALNCWAFTPHSFMRLGAELAEAGVLPFECWGALVTEHGEAEFFVGLAPNADPAACARSWRRWLPGPTPLRHPSHRWPDASGPDVLTQFIAYCRDLPAPRVLELGCKRSIPDVSTLHKVWVPHAREWVGSDVAPGEDVDVVADVHRLSDAVGAESFDALVNGSCFEHFKYPQLAAHEIMKVLKVGGVLFVQTHQSFPLHGYPYDYYRFSREALASLFPRSMGFEVLATGYNFPASIEPRGVAHVSGAEAWLNSCLFARKVAPTPKEFVYELGVP